MAASPRTLRKANRGFTLVELVMVIILMGIIGGIVAVFMKGPIDAYFAGGRRAALTDVADTTVRRIARDLHRALPNSVRTSGTSCLEFVPTKIGGRYRANGPGALTFDAAVSTFNMLGDYTQFAGAALPGGQVMAAGDLIVVYNLGITGADVYSNNNYSPVTSLGTVSANETPINITAKQFPLPSASNRFQVVPSSEKLVSYVCDSTTSTLYRSVNTALTASANCPVSTAGTVSASVIATHVDCANTSFSITDAGNALNRNALVSMRLTLLDSSSTETVTLQHEVHVDNTP
jgi:MSHA biogenesis protein MshO